MGEIVQGWKVLTSERKSTTALGKYALEYPVGARVGPAPGTNWVMGFRTQEDAFFFSGHGCLVVPTKGELLAGPVPQWVVDTAMDMTDEDAEKSLDSYWLGMGKHHIHRAPTGSAFFKWIECEE